ncbi:MAG: hypothetical protein E5Y52_28890, partial [Mesorhizobium sp.]
MVGRASKLAIIATFLTGVLAVAGCTAVTPQVESEPMTKQKVVRTTTTPKVIKQKKVTAKKPIEPA